MKAKNTEVLRQNYDAGFSQDWLCGACGATFEPVDLESVGKSGVLCAACGSPWWHKAWPMVSVGKGKCPKTGKSYKVKMSAHETWRLSLTENVDPHNRPITQPLAKRLAAFNKYVEGLPEVKWLKSYTRLVEKREMASDRQNERSLVDEREIKRAADGNKIRLSKKDKEALKAAEVTETQDGKHVVIPAIPGQPPKYQPFIGGGNTKGKNKNGLLPEVLRRQSGIKEGGNMSAVELAQEGLSITR